MVDQNRLFENKQELKFSGEQGFFDKSRVIRYFIVFIFALTLFTFLHFREVRVDVLELNSSAPGFVISQVDFQFPDEEATLINRQNALRDFGKIYLISPVEIKKNKDVIENSKVEKKLLKLRFTSPKTIQELKKIGFSTDDYFLSPPPASINEVKLPFSILQDLTADDPELKVSLENDRWSLQEDQVVRKEIKKFLDYKIPYEMKKVEAGDRIIDQGEKVTTRHLSMIQSMKTALGESRQLSYPSTWLGTLILTLLLVTIFFAYFKTNQPLLLLSNRKLFLLVTILILTLGLSKLAEFFLLNSRTGLIDVFRYPLFVPLAAILICSLINPAVATFSAGFLAIVSVIALAFDWEGLLLLNISASIVAILNTHTLRRRKEIFVVCLKAWFTCVAAIVALHLYHSSHVSGSMFTDILSAGFFMLLTAILVVGFLPLLEAGFGVMTDVTLMEYMDPNNDLLRRLALDASGTYQHSVVVGNLAEAAALAIGANGLFCRVATLYHDIGKIATSQYFTENQEGDVNIHTLLTPQESAQAIMAHVSEGVVLGRQAGLPEPIIDVIKEHHGTSLVYYFYRKEVEKIGDKTKVDEKEFRYAGPKPRSKESGIIMITDSFEAASRSLDEVNEKTLSELVDKIIRGKFHDGQLDDCNLSFEEVKIIAKTLVKTLLAAGHSRVKYPAEEPKEVSL